MDKHIFTVGNSWDEILEQEMDKPYFDELMDFLDYEYSNYNIFPDKDKIFHALRLTPFERVKVVIIGQDPYHGCGQAEGLAFSVPRGCPIPPSLRNIYTELNNDTGVNIPSHGSLYNWAERGVLLINTVLTVREGEANSHKGKGWETFSDSIIKALSDRNAPVIFILWGNYAISKNKLIDKNKHHIIASPHPSPLSARLGFFGSTPFSRANAILGADSIDWSIDI